MCVSGDTVQPDVPSLASVHASAARAPVAGRRSGALMNEALRERGAPGKDGDSLSPLKRESQQQLVPPEPGGTAGGDGPVAPPTSQVGRA